MKLTATTFLTLDGVMQAPGGPEEDTTGGFQHGGWVAPLFGEDDGRFIDSWFARAGAFLLGRRTFEIFAGFWPQVTDPDNEVARLLNELPKYVVSTGSPDLSWHNSEQISGDVAGRVAELKRAQGDELQVHGSGRLLGTLLEHDLVDELRLITFPVTLGSGRRLFPDGFTKAFTLVSADTTAAGALVTTYRPAGEPRYGTAGLTEEEGVVRETMS
ncbi:dihydrofolate reductase family protein [Saccharopolyspora griseoalba]|uniref:Dihydrofolate reductase family protein n=1 Tax=Saccharopolyspora griseoalba TaxID=1431848 RepID=A0ABW2LIR1_9PSEU